ncbi:MAG: hypothetical protein DSY43_05555 [Gammaproteobacteria bacterium]|nr:MAG: hypothetical protein DSY43_05555 [Gammaproteobacteria bacterium]
MKMKEKRRCIKRLCNNTSKMVTEEDERLRPVYYLPHHPVIREDKTTTKCRIVFDVSARNQGISLNDCLLAGPALQPNLASILLRFRLHRVAIMADLRKMFLQIKLARKDQNCHRFVWRESQDEDPKVYCMSRITFGVVSSPFEAIATVQHHATVNKDEFPRAAKEIKENMYVDDLLSGEEDIEKAYVLHKDLYALMKNGGFELVKWYTNSKELLDLIEPELRGPTTLVPLSKEEEPLKALGISWNTKDDTFLFNQGEKLVQAQDEGTKRSLISIASKLFDPLGFLGPFTIRANILFQELWSKGIQWDESLDEEINTEWLKWKEELKALKELQVPRCFYTELDKVTEVELHGFCDASTKAYGAAVYIRCKDNKGSTTTQLVMAKSKVAPTKRITLPRLELLAAYILSKLMKFVLESITIKIQDVMCWSDSQVTLAWIRQPSQKWKVFVANRVQEIQEIILPEQWHYCPGKSNPADLLTRGESLPNLIHNKTWWNGPEWLAEDPKKWPERKNPAPRLEDLEIPQRDMFLSEAKKTATTLSSTESFQLEDRFETWQRLVRVTAWMLKWSRLHRQSKLGYLTADEIKDAEHTLIKNVQKNAFSDEIKELEQGKQIPKASKIVKLDPQINNETGLLVVGGRLQFALIPEEAKHQVILPHKNTLTEKLVLHVHCKANHAGPETTLGIIRQRFWPIQGRREVKRILRKCLICKHWKTIPIQQKMAPLPLERVQIVPPFTNIGLDFTGPLYLKVKGEPTLAKAYICIFVCEDTRAVHLELTNNMTTEEFLQAYRRMVSRRGVPRVIRSDNQTTFHKAARVFKISKQKSKLANINPKEVESRLANDHVTWKFITERASHRGGHWERVCRQIKEPLRRVLGKALLTYTEMYTVLTGIEAIINSRPLTFIGDDIRDGRVITPALLAIGRDLGSVPDEPVREVSLDERYYYQQQLQNHFWDRWMREYLPSLTVRQKWTEEMKPLKENDVVLITDDNVSRGHWRLGKVVQTFPGTDGLTRTVRILTKRGLVNRPVQRLHLLEEYKVTQRPSSVVQVPQRPSSVVQVPQRPSSVVQQHPSTIKLGQHKSMPKSKANERRNGSSPLKGEDVQARSRYGRLLKKPHRFRQ